MNNVRIATKLVLSFLFFAMLTAILGVYLENSLENVNERDKILHDQGVVPLSMLIKTAEQAQELRIKTYEWQMAKNNAGRAAALKGLDQSYDILKDVINKQIELAINEEGRKTMRDLQAAIDEFIKEVNNFTKANSSGYSGDFPESISNAAAKFFKAGGASIEYKIQAAEKISKENDEIANKATVIAKVAIALIFLLSIFFGLYITFSITRPLKVVVGELSKMENGDMTVRSNLIRKDELGVLAKALDSLAYKFQSIIKGLLADSGSLASAAEELSTVGRELASEAEETVNQSTNVASTAEQMAVNINAMASGAEQASMNANEVASAAEQMSVNMHTIAAAIEEMSASISQISGNAGEAKEVAGEAMDKSYNATKVMNKLGIAAKEIGKVTDVIKKIADKTNLLALNATIEAASAGEAGKGFAVVASEIKELANQSAISADDITQRIEGIQHGAGDAVNAIEEVSDIIIKINNSVEAIAGHVDQQTKASNEIANSVSQASIGAKRVAGAIGEVAKGANDVSRNASEAAKGATYVSQNVASVSQVAKESAQGAVQVNNSAGELSKVAGYLRDTVNKFKV